MKIHEEIKVRQYVMVIEEVPEGGFSGTFPDVPGCFTQGGTMEELLANAEDALETHFSGLLENGLPIPEPKSSAAKRLGQLHLHIIEYPAGALAVYEHALHVF